MIKWSFSGIKDFTNCPRQYHEVKILQNYVKAVTEKMQYGTDVHKALEDYARDKTPMPLFYQKYQPAIDALLDIPGEKYLEHKMALTADKVPCAFDGPDYWVRGIVDFMVIDGDSAHIIDYKTGSPRFADTNQLKLMALMTFASFPQVNNIKAALLFITKGGFSDEAYTRDDINRLWKVFEPSLNWLSKAFENDAWPARPNPFCRSCPVVTCEYYRG
jgi:CRISPR/Cas system-associated exonuclease Cas4 (RecB family)